MTDASPSDDELLSSFLDGELTAGERTRLDERLAQDPALAARLDAMRAAADLVATPVEPLGDRERDAFVAAALAASTTSPAVTDLAAARSRRSIRRGARIAGAAAGIVLIALAVPTLIDRGDDDEDFAGDTETTALNEAEGDDALEMTGDAGAADAPGDLSAAGESTGDGAGDGAGDGGDEAEMGGAPTADSLADDGDEVAAALDAASLRALFGLADGEGLGAFASAAELTREVEARYNAFNAANDGAGFGGPVEAASRAERLTVVGLDDCTAEVEALESSLPPIVTVDEAIAEVAGDPHAVLLYALADGSITAAVIAQATCDVVDSVELRPAG